MDIKADTQAPFPHDGGKTASSSSSIPKLSNVLIRFVNNGTQTGENSPKIGIFIVQLSRPFYRQWGRIVCFVPFFPVPFRPSIQDLSAITIPIPDSRYS